MLKLRRRAVEPIDDPILKMRRRVRAGFKVISEIVYIIKGGPATNFVNRRKESVALNRTRQVVVVLRARSTQTQRVTINDC